MKAEPIFTQTFKPFFTNGQGWIGFRPLTSDDFTVEIRIPTRDEVLNSVKRGYGDFASIHVKLTMTEQTIYMLNEVKWFTRFSRPVDFSELTGVRERQDAIEISDYAISKGFASRLKTDSGGRIRKDEKILQVIDETLEALTKEFEANKEEKIQSLINQLVNSKIGKFVEDLNQQETRSVVNVMTERKTLDSILETNKDKNGVALAKEVHETQLEAIDAEIKVYKDAIEKLQEQKSEVYKNTADSVFKNKMGDIPPSVQEEIDAKGRYKQSKNPFGF
jgi:hypothetical protein